MTAARLAQRVSLFGRVGRPVKPVVCPRCERYFPTRFYERFHKRYCAGRLPLLER